VKKVLILHGPNLNLLGTREPDVYGSLSLKDLNSQLSALGMQHGFEIHCVQSNVEGELVNLLHEHGFDSRGIIFNPGGYTHTSVALRDAVASIESPVIEVHISHPEAREDFRHQSWVRPVCCGAISGMGVEGYFAALRFFMGAE
jgi:3-dehydroquinate dehydratase-2